MAHRVIFRTAARDEAIQAAAYIAEHGSPASAIGWYEALEQAVASLSEHPERCAYAREKDRFRDIELRQLVFKSHRIIFTVRGNEVHVLHVRHAHRDLMGGSGDG